MENTNYIKTGIKFTRFIALNRNMDKEIFYDSKLLNLLIYIAIRVKRQVGDDDFNLYGVDLNVGEFLIGRPSTVSRTDLSEQEYKTRIEKLQKLKIIDVAETTNKYTIGKWLENSFIDLNLVYDNYPANNQRNIQRSTTTNNININSPNVNSLNTLVTNILSKYMEYKGIELKGRELNKNAVPIKEMLESGRTTENIIGLMRWFNDNENKEQYPWINGWTIWTVQKKLPEFLAGKLKVKDWKDDFERI